ncbi:hypothetical protein FJ364_04610, partial [Candidatus Dependentiae bacterium]|nr:hypothetical protein [Candidatus Dependentiae bacterium]
MKKFVIFLAIIALILPIAIFFSKKDRQKIITNNTSIETPQREVWLNIFVHGTFGTLTGLLSLNSVLKDDVRGTTYRGVNKGMRNDAYFFQTQPILERGLQKLTPSFNPDDTNKKILAAYPITKIHDEFFKKINPNDHSKQYYYTFGWSGLISQYRRRFEAIRLYNALEEEIELLKKQNITPRIRIYAYSHGGNLCLNLGGIASVLNTKTFKEFYKYSLDPQADDSIKKMLAIIKNLPTKEDAFLLEGQKRFDYIPTNKNFFIDELILLGTPIQSETEHFLHSSVFGTIYNIYSSQDTVQKLDWISTK